MNYELLWNKLKENMQERMIQNNLESIHVGMLLSIMNNIEINSVTTQIKKPIEPENKFISECSEYPI